MELNILGSCVTRDCFNFLDDPELKLNYIARQSIASFCSPPISEQNIANIKFNEDLPNFERVMTMLDMSKKYMSIINIKYPIVIDFIEERFFLLKYTGSYLTYSIGMKRTNITEQKVRQISSYTPNRLKFTMQFMDRFISIISRFDKIILHRAFYDENFPNYCFDIPYVNEYLNTLYAYMEKKVPNIHIISIPENVTKSFLAHRWGPAPFHFIDDYYKCFMEQLTSYLGMTWQPNAFTLESAAS